MLMPRQFDIFNIDLRSCLFLQISLNKYIEIVVENHFGIFEPSKVKLITSYSNIPCHFRSVQRQNKQI